MQKKIHKRYQAKSAEEMGFKLKESITSKHLHILIKLKLGLRNWRHKATKKGVNL